MPRPILSTTGRRQRPIDTSAGRFSSNAIVFAVCAPRDWDENGLEKSPLAGCYDAWHLVYGRTNQPGQSNKHNYLSQSVGYGNSRRTAYCCLYIDCRVFFFSSIQLSDHFSSAHHARQNARYVLRSSNAPSHINLSVAIMVSCNQALTAVWYAIVPKRKDNNNISTTMILVPTSPETGHLFGKHQRRKRRPALLSIPTLALPSVEYCRCRQKRQYLHDNKNKKKRDPQPSPLCVEPAPSSVPWSRGLEPDSPTEACPSPPTPTPWYLPRPRTIPEHRPGSQARGRSPSGRTGALQRVSPAVTPYRPHSTLELAISSSRRCPAASPAASPAGAPGKT